MRAGLPFQHSPVKLRLLSMSGSRLTYSLDLIPHIIRTYCSQLKVLLSTMLKYTY